MKKFFVIAAAALALVACNKEQKVEVAPQDEAIAVAFDAYLNRGVATKAGQAEELTTAKLQTPGFGVFAYYTDGDVYDNNSTPNFMYNQKVSGATWTYEPVKYWPNEYGDNAIADERDKVSFFAYAPYVKVTPSNGKIDDADVTVTTWGITGLTRNAATGDPMVKYIVSFDPAKSVDLLWGVVPAGTTTWNISNSAGTQAVDEGKPWLNVERPKTAADQKLKFEFNHALASLNVQIDADPDIAAHATSPAIAAGTKVYVRSITFKGFAMKGALNLNNTDANKAYWKDYAGVDDLMTGEEVTIYDGRKDGKEGALDALASNEKLQGLNPVIISDNGNTTVGVTADYVNLFAGTDKDTRFFVIPTGDKVDVTIVYDVETADPNLAGYLSDGKTLGSSVQNTITKENVFAEFENGKEYNLKIHLGLTSVKFDAEVADWAAGTDAESWLPANN